jgi:hypothetical protein
MATASEVQSLYIAYFGRPADPDGLAYWTTGVGASTPLAEIATGFATTAEFQATTAGRPLVEVINKFYLNLFNRNGEVAGINFWVGEVTAGRVTIEAVGLNIAQAALALPPTNTDRISEESKITAAGRWTSAVGSTTEGLLAYTGENGILAGRAFLAPVVSPATTPSVAQTDAAVAAFVAGGGGGPNTLNLTTGVDIYTSTQGSSGGVANPLFRFSGENQFVNADAATLTPGDTLIDPSASDSDSLTVSSVSLINLLPGNDDNQPLTGTLNVSNIENLNFGLVSGRGVYDFGDLTFNGARTIRVTGTFSADNFDSGFQDWDNTGATTFDASGLTGTSSGGGEFLIQADTTPADLTVIGSSGNDNILTDNGNDNVNAGAGDDFVNTDRGADTVTLGAGFDTFRFDFGTGTGGDGGGQRTSFLSGNAVVDNGDTFNFNGPIDTILDFSQAQDVFDVNAANAAFNLAGAAANIDIAFNNNYFIRGDWAGTSFTVNNAGQDTLVLASDFNGGVQALNGNNVWANSNNYFVLQGFSGTLASGNFV